MNKRAFLVMGAPSSGTRIMTRILIAAGCIGDGDHVQRFDRREPTEDLIVFRRHHPQERLPIWVDAELGLVRAVEQLGYDTTVVIMTRDWGYTIKSQIAAPHAFDTSAAYVWLHTCWEKIFHWMPSGTNFEVVSYESIVNYPQSSIPLLLGRLRLNPWTQVEPIIDGNEKHLLIRG